MHEKLWVDPLIYKLIKLEFESDFKSVRFYYKNHKFLNANIGTDYVVDFAGIHHKFSKKYIGFYPWKKWDEKVYNEFSKMPIFNLMWK